MEVFEKKLLKSEEAPLFKMQKSIVARKNLKKGDKISLKDLDIKSLVWAHSPYKIEDVVGKKLKKVSS